MDTKEEKDNEAFLVNSFSILFGSHQFAFDFKQRTPKVEDFEGGGHQKKMVVWHKPIIMNPALAKKLVEILGKNIKEYEKKFGEIEIKENDDKKNKDKKEKEEISYIG